MSSVRQYAFGRFHFDAAQRILFRGADSVPLTPKLIETVEVLVTAPVRRDP